MATKKSSSKSTKPSKEELQAVWLAVVNSSSLIFEALTFLERGAALSGSRRLAVQAMLMAAKGQLNARIEWLQGVSHD